MFTENGRETLRVFRKEGVEYIVSNDDEGMAYMINDGYEFVKDVKEIIREPAEPRAMEGQ